MKSYYFSEVGKAHGLGHLARYHGLAELLPELDIEIVLNESSDPEYVGGAKTWSNADRSSYEILFYESDVLFVDTYIGDRDFFEATNSVNNVIYIDDYLKLERPRGLVIDWTADAENCRKKTGEKSLFGLRYLVTRSSFQSSSRIPKPVKLEKILTIFGGSDLNNLTPKFFAALSTGFDVTCVGTSMYPCFASCKHLKNFRFDLCVDDLVNEILSSDLVISAGGQTLYEIAALRVPLVAVSTTDNQELDVAGFHKLGLAKELKLDCVNWETLSDWLGSIEISDLERMTERMSVMLGDGHALRDEVLDYVHAGRIRL